MPRPTFAAMLAIAMMAEGRASAAGTKQACVDASTEGQALRDGAKLVEARSRFVACARDECPAVVRRYCVDWLADVERRQPTVIFRAQTTDGADVTDAHIAIDGAPEPQALGTAIPLDPGEHSVHATRAGASALDLRVVIIEGEKGRVVSLRFAVPAPPAAAPIAPLREAPAAHAPRASLSPLTLVFAGVGVVGIGGFAGFGLKAQGDLNHLRQTCAPYCASSDLDTVKHEALVADISLGVGVVALGAAAVTFFAHGKAPESRALVEVRPVLGGAIAQLGARF